MKHSLQQAPLDPICYTCHKEDDGSFMKCGHCEAWKFCSRECSDEYATIHHQVCCDHSSDDPKYVSNQLARAIVDMEEDVFRRFEPIDKEHAYQVLGELLEARDEDDNDAMHTLIPEAHEIIGDVLYDFPGSVVFTKHDGAYQGEFANYQMEHLVGMAFDRIGDSISETKQKLEKAKERSRALLKQYRLAKKDERGLRRQLRSKRREVRRAERGVKVQKKKLKQAERRKKRAS